MKKFLGLGILATSFVFADQPSEVTSIMQAPEVAERECEQVIQIEAVPVKAAYGYVSLGVVAFPYPVPLLGVGGRYQNGHHGVDGSIQFVSIGRPITLMKANVDYLYYFKPNLKSQVYMGGGVGLIQYWGRYHKMETGLSPQLVIGKQFTTRTGGVRFFQAQIDPVLLDLTRVHKHYPHVRALPIVTFSYGFCF